jgi:hypothetical protein
VSAVRVAEHVDPLLIDSVLEHHSRDQLSHEVHVIDILSLGWKGRVLAAIVPISAIAIGIQNYKSVLIGQTIELITSRYSHARSVHARPVKDNDESGLLR